MSYNDVKKKTMSHRTTSDWDELVKLVAARWTLSESEAAEQMVSVIRHALFDPALALVISASGLLKMTAEAQNGASADWITACHEASQKWLRQYRLIEHHCSRKWETTVQICACILQQIGPLFTNSSSLYQHGETLISQFELPYDEAYDMLLRALGRLKRVSNELANDNLNWLWSYINEKTF